MRPAALALAVLAGLVYAGALSNGFVFDDEGYVAANPHVRQGLAWPTVRWAFTAVHSSNYHPLTWLSHALDWSLWGPDPWGHHLTGIVLHAANTALLFLLLAGTTGRAGRSACVAALFAVHPLHVESVAWVAERKDTLSTLFFLLALHAYARYAAGGRRRAYALALGFMALGMLAKQMVVTLPAVLLLLDFWPLGRLTRRVLAEKLPFLAVSIAGAVAAIVAQGRGGSLIGLEAIPLGQRVANAALSYVRYLGMAAWPDGLAFFYPFRPVPAWQAVACGALLAATTALALRHARRHPAAAMGWLFYLVTLLPVIGLVQVGDQALADRYTYIPLIGIFIAACWLLPDAVLRARPAWTPVAVAVVAALSALTVRQVRTWRDEPTLYAHALSVTTDNYLAHDNLGTVLASGGQVREAEQHFREAVRIRPRRAVAHSNLGSALNDLGRSDEAIAAHREAVRLDPADAASRRNLGASLASVGRAEEAAAELAEAVRLDPSDAGAREYLARVLLTHAMQLAGAGRHRLALARLREASAAQPESPAVQAALAFVMATSDDPAVRDPGAALDLATRARAATGTANPYVLDAMAASLAASGRPTEAVREIDLALPMVGEPHPLRAALQARRAQYALGRPVVLRHVEETPPAP